MTIPRLYCIGLTLAGPMALSGCDNGGLGEVRQWMDETRQQTKVDVPKLSEPKKYLPFSYAQRDSVDPYSPTKLAIALAKAKGKIGRAHV